MKMSQRNKLCVLSNFFGMIPSRPVTLKEGDLVGAEGRVRIEKEIAVKFFTFKCGSEPCPALAMKSRVSSLLT